MPVVPSAAKPAVAATSRLTVRAAAGAMSALTVKLAAVPSATAAPAAMLSSGTSSSVILIDAPATVSVPAEPVRLSVSSASSRASSVGVSVKSAVALDSPAGIAILKEAGDAA